MVKPLLIFLTLLLAVPNFINKDINDQGAYDQKEHYLPKFSTLNSIRKLEKFTDDSAARAHILQGSPEYILLLSDIISNRFYHGFSHWRLNENWIAAVGEKITGIGLSCKVEPDAMLLHPNAACSQQAMVMMQVLENKHIDYRKVGFPHHYAIEAKSGQDWYYFDPNMELNMTLAQRKEVYWKRVNDSLKQYYDLTIHPNISYQFGINQAAFIGPTNEHPAKHVLLFQRVTMLLSKILWAIPLVMLLIKRPAFLFRKKNSMDTETAKDENLQPAFSA